VIQEGNRNSDRYTYIGVNSRGQKLKITNGVGYVKDSSETIYTFATKNDARFIIGDSHDGKAILSRSQGDGPSTTFNCTLSSQGKPGSNHS